MKKLSILFFAFLIGFSAKADEGMWMINMINKALEKNMKARGLKLSAKEIYNADAEGATISDAVVSMAFGCTGSIISDNGLLITNHHCAYGDVHSISNNEHNYLEEGFWAMRSDEERNIPGKTVWFLKKIIDVTDEVDAMVAELKSQGKPSGMRKVSFMMESKYSKESGLEASLGSMWRGSKYYMALYEVYSDVRLVAAPPVSISAYGGDIDNWEWPQHKCDFAMYRIYTAPDGSPAEYSEANVPLKPKNKLKISLKGYKPGDYAMVIGYPGSTNRYMGSAEADYLETLRLPISNKLRGKQMETINSWMSRDDEIRLKYSDYYFGLSNVQELNSGEVKCFRRFDVVEEKQKQEKEMQAWIEADPERKAKWGDVIRLLGEKYAAVAEAERDLCYYRETLVMGTRLSRMVGRIYNLSTDVFKEQGINIKALGNNPEKDSTYVNCCRKHRFCANKYPTINRMMAREYAEIDMRVEHDLLREAIVQYFENVNPKHFTPYQKALLEEFTDAEGRRDYDGIMAKIWNGSFFTDKARYDEMVNGEHCLQDFLNDPLYCFLKGNSMMNFNEAIKKCEGDKRRIDLERAYTHILYQMREEKGIVQYPDANSTMRLTYGVVGDVKPFDAISCSHQSTAKGILEKYDPTSYEFNLDDKQKGLLEAQDWGRWGAKGEMPVNFLTDNDITGGNSGSPVMNAKGELIGLAFDGNKESLAGDASFTVGYNKCVCVDIRYVLWVLDKYAGMNHILEEIGI